MIAEAIARYPWLWTLVWQSTACLTAGLAGSHLLRRRAVRAHQLLLLSLIAAAVLPAMTQVVKQNQWGLFVAERAVPEPQHLTPPPPVEPVMPRPRPAAGPSMLPAMPQGVETVPTPGAAAKFEWTRAILLAWLVASSILLLRLASQFLLGRRVVKRSKSIDEPQITGMIEAARTKLGIATAVAARTGEHIRSPVIWCWARRLILLIPADSCRESELDWMSILYHELAHWKRRDHLSGLFAELLICALPWQPLAWWARQRLIALSEEACDDWVMAAGQRATNYARTLLGLAPQGQAGLIPGVVPSRKGLAGRIHRILHNACGNPHLGPQWTAASIALVICIIFGVAFAQNRPAAETPRTQDQQQPADAADNATEESERSEGKIALRLMDPNGRPVLGAKAGAYVQVRDTFALGANVRWSSEGLSDREGQITLDANDVFFPSHPDRTSLYILHKRRGLGAVHEVTRETSDDHVHVVVLKPVCRVHGTLDSTGLAAIGMPLRTACMDVHTNRNTLLEYLGQEEKHDFDFPLPPGVYTFYAGGSGNKGESPPRISAGTEHKTFPVTISEGQRDLDLSVIDLRPTKIATLIGRPAPEIGPMKGWRHGPGIILAELKGQIVWLHFGGRYPSVSRDLPILAELHEAFAGKGLTIMAIYNCASLEELAQRWSEMNKQFGGVQDVPFRIAIDGGEPTSHEGVNAPRPGATYGRYDIISTANVLIDPAGFVVGQPNLFYAKEIISRMLAIRENASLPDWQQRFNAVYRLADDEILKRIALPFIPERMEYYRNEHEHQAELIPRGRDQMTFHWDGKLRNWGMGFGSFGRLGSVLNGVLRLKSYEYEGPKSLLDIDLAGDWIIRDEASPEAKLQALEGLVAKELGRRIRFDKRSVEREVIVATGRFNFHPPVGTYENTSVHMCATETDPDEGAGGGTAKSVPEFLQRLGDHVSMPIVDQAEPGEQMRVPYRHHRSSRVGRIQDEQERARQLKVLLDHLTEQTELRFEIRKEPVSVWFVTELTDR